jgi:hypothetical protein
MDMSGSNMVAILAPVVALPLMAFWLIMVFHADSHPGYRHRPPLPVPDAPAAAMPGPRPEVTPEPPGERAPAGGPDAVRQHEDKGKVPAGL